MGDFYILAFRTLEVESARIISQVSKKFTLGARLRPGLEFNSPEIGGEAGLLRAEAKSNVNFNAGLYGAYNFSPLFSFQAELVLAFNSGILVRHITGLFTLRPQ